MKTTKKIVWGIILIVIAAGLAVYAFMPELEWFSGISVWKLILGAVLAWWLINNLIFGKSLREHFDIFLPLGLLFIVFKSNIAGGALDFISSWIVIVIAVLLTTAVNLLFEDAGKKEHKCSEADGCMSSSGKSAIYLDLAERNEFTTDNRFGSMHIYFQNTDMGDPAQSVKLNFSNEFGETVIHVPSDWRVTAQVKNSLGGFKVRPNPENCTRELIVSGSNRFGDTNICS